MRVLEGHYTRRARNKLDRAIDGLPFDGPPESFGKALADATGELEEARREFETA